MKQETIMDIWDPKTLRQKQALFAFLIAGLIQKAYDEGYTVTLGDAARTDKQGHRDGSMHYIRLAIDLNLFKDGKYLTSTEAHRFLGEWWEKQHELCRWGGRFKDGNHYSLTHWGRA